MMYNNGAIVVERSILIFSVEGLQAHEEVLFKAFVRLLDHLTHEKWVYQPLAPDQRIDLLVVADGIKPSYSQAPNQQPQSVLRIGSTETDGQGNLSWPLKPNALENELNRLGGIAVRQRSLQTISGLLTAPIGATIAPAASPQLMRLTQWPPTRLLADPGRMRLATLLTGNGMSLPELVSRSALPLPVCKNFIEDLQLANLLKSHSISQHHMPQPTALLPKAVRPGLIDKIRMRLGIKRSSQ